MTTRILPVLILTIILTTAPVRAQETAAVPMLTDSSRSIQFGIDYLALRSFNNKNISYKTHLSGTTAVRFGLVLSGSITKENRMVRKFSGDTLISDRRNTVTPDPSAQIMITADYLWYTKAADDLYLYAGAGPQFGWTQRHYDNDFSRHWTVAVTGIVGAEWFASRTISLHSEYNTGLYYNISKESSWDSWNDTAASYYENNSTSLTLRSGNVLFGLSVYF